MGEFIKFIVERHSGQKGSSPSLIRTVPHAGHCGGNSMSAKPETIFFASHIIIENGQFLCGFFDGHSGHIRPQPLNVVKFPNRFIKDMYYHVTIIHQNPAPGTFSLDSNGEYARFFQLPPDMSGEPFYLPV